MRAVWGEVDVENANVINVYVGDTNVGNINEGDADMGDTNTGAVDDAGVYDTENDRAMIMP